MRILLSLSILLVSGIAIADDVQLKLYSPTKKTYEKITITNINGLKISKGCLNSKQKCGAQVAVDNPKKLSESNIGLTGNPAARYCQSYSAVSRILKNEKNQEYDFCVFPDGSMIDAWSLYGKHHKESP